MSAYWIVFQYKEVRSLVGYDDDNDDSNVHSLSSFFVFMIALLTKSTMHGIYLLVSISVDGGS